jgi:hypothetical protein
MQTTRIDTQSAGRESRQSVCRSRVVRDGRNPGRFVDRDQVLGSGEYRDLRVRARWNGGGDLDHVAFGDRLIFPEHTFAS